MITWCLCFLEICSAIPTTLHFQCFCFTVTDTVVKNQNSLQKRAKWKHLYQLAINILILSEQKIYIEYNAHPHHPQ